MSDSQLPLHEGCIGPDCPICRNPSRFPDVDFQAISDLAKTDRAAFAAVMTDLCMGPEPAPYVPAPRFPWEHAVGVVAGVVVLIWWLA